MLTIITRRQIDRLHSVEKRTPDESTWIIKLVVKGRVYPARLRMRQLDAAIQDMARTFSPLATAAGDSPERG